MSRRTRNADGRIRTQDFWLSKNALENRVNPGGGLVQLTYLPSKSPSSWSELGWSTQRTEPGAEINIKQTATSRTRDIAACGPRRCCFHHTKRPSSYDIHARP